MLCEAVAIGELGDFQTGNSNGPKCLLLFLKFHDGLNKRGNEGN